MRLFRPAEAAAPEKERVGGERLVAVREDVVERLATAIEALVETLKPKPGEEELWRLGIVKERGVQLTRPEGVEFTRVIQVDYSNSSEAEVLFTDIEDGVIIYSDGDNEIRIASGVPGLPLAAGTYFVFTRTSTMTKFYLYQRVTGSKAYLMFFRYGR